MSVEDQGWTQVVIAGLATAASGVATHLYTLVNKRSAALHKRIDEVEGEHVKKDMLAVSLGSLEAVQRQAREDHRIMAEKVDDIARDLNILIGKFDARFSDDHR